MVEFNCATAFKPFVQVEKEEEGGSRGVLKRAEWKITRVRSFLRTGWWRLAPAE